MVESESVSTTYQSCSLQLSHRAEYLLQRGTEEGRLLLLLHGFRQEAAWMHQHIVPQVSFAGTILSVQGLFPVPFKRGADWELGYAWYFFDQRTGAYKVGMEPAVAYVKALLEQLGLASTRQIQIVGFSQGGYLAPFVAQELDGSVQVILLGGRLRSEVLTSQYSFRLDALHGRTDDWVDGARAERCHQEVLACGNTGEFGWIEDTGHEINAAMALQLERLLRLF